MFDSIDGARKPSFELSQTRQQENCKSNKPKIHKLNTTATETRRIFIMISKIIVSILALSTLSHATLAIRNAPRRLNDPTWSVVSEANTIVTCNDIERIDIDTIDIDDIDRKHVCYNENVRQHCPESCPSQLWNSLVRWRKYEPVEHCPTMLRQNLQQNNLLTIN